MDLAWSGEDDQKVAREGIQAESLAWAGKGVEFRKAGGRDVRGMKGGSLQ